MGYQPEYGERLVRERFAEETIPYYRIIKQGTTETKVKLGTVGCKPIGVTLESQEWGRKDGSGGIVKRTGYIAKDIPEAQATGIAFVELGETVTQGQLCVSDSTGRGIAGDLTDSSLVTDLEPVAGTFLEGGDEGDIVRLDLDRRQ